MKNLLFLISVLWLSATTAIAQFPTSDKLYCYKYVKTIEDDVMYDNSYKNIKVVYFQDDLIAYESYSETDLLEYINEPTKLKEKLKKNLENNIKWWNTKDLKHDVYFYRYFSGLSSSSQYTYRIQRGTYTVSTIYSSIDQRKFYNELVWEETCHTFSIDRKQMVNWNIENPDEKDYYELVEWDSLRPNLNFFE